jgi:hypothetical protein
MKKLLILFVVAFACSCGQSAEEKAKMEQAHQDSIKAAEDMMKAAEEAASIAAQADTTVADSIAGK